MDNNELNNEDNEHIVTPSSALNDYETEVSNKQNFFSSLLDKFKTNKTQKLLTNGKDSKIHKTNKSISSLWGLGNIRASLFTSLDNVRKAISNRFYSKEPRNSLAIEVISESTKGQVEKSINNDDIQEIKESPIIPNGTPKNIINTAKLAQDVRIELASINTSAIKKTSKKSTAKKPNSVTISTTETIAPDEPSRDARE